jgi:hypothetical protein
VLDEELAKLPEPMRAAVVLCDLGGKTRAEAAADLGCPEGTVAARLHRARKALADRLARRGVTAPAAPRQGAIAARRPGASDGDRSGRVRAARRRGVAGGFAACFRRPQAPRRRGDLAEPRRPVAGQRPGGAGDGGGQARPADPEGVGERGQVGECGQVEKVGHDGPRGEGGN